MQTFFLQREIIGKRKRLSPQLDELQIKIQKVWRLLLTLAHFVRFYPPPSPPLCYTADATAEDEEN